MDGPRLPTDLQGDWIWHGDATEKLESYVFLRHEFPLTEVPSEAELWLAVNSGCHLYVNGRHLSRGPSPGVGKTRYASLVDIAYCLQMGRNVVAVLAHNTQVSRYGQQRCRSGFWCQINADSRPIVRTDASWQAINGTCYQGNQPRVSPGDGFVESVDLRTFPHDWMEMEGGSELAWEKASAVFPAADGPYNLRMQPECEVTSEKFDLFNLVARGEASQSQAFTHMSFARAPQEVEGVYAAETYVHTYEDLPETRLQFYSDDPYHLIINNKQVKAQGTRHYIDWSDPTWNTPRCYQQEAMADESGVVSLTAGWNHIVVIQQVGPASAGATLVLPEIEAGAVKFVRGNNNFSLPGWNLMGPLRVPFARIDVNLSLDSLEKSSFYGQSPTDVAACLMAHTYRVVEETEMPVDSIELNQGEYAIIELDSYVRGCPSFMVSGAGGDLLDLIYSDRREGATLLPVEEGVRKVCSLVLDNRPANWHAAAPHGMKYLMLYARQAKGAITLEDMAIRKSVYNFREPATFACSDELFNQIWEVGVNTLEAGFDSIFLNTAGDRSYQLLADAMIQSLASFYVFGNYEMSAKALREFAEAQFETGEIPAIVPGDINVCLHDMALLWPVWLQKHVLHSGDQELLKDMLPHLERLLVYFEGNTSDDELLLGNSTPPYDVPCLIDYDGTIERRGVSTGLNSLYCHALLKSEWLFAQMGMSAEAQVCHDRASAVARATRELNWDEEKGLFADSWLDDQRAESHSMQANVLALYTGVAKMSQYQTIFDNMFMDYAPYHKMTMDQENDTPYFKYFLLDATFALQLREWAVDYMRYYWGKMLSEGATTWWQNFCPDIEYGPAKASHLCHGYGVSPNYFMMTEVLGVRPATPGYTQVYFNPLLSAVEWARAQLPTPNGTLQVDWSFRDTGELQIVIEANYPLEVVPLLDPNVASSAILHVNDEVTILYHEEETERKELDDD